MLLKDISMPVDSCLGEECNHSASRLKPQARLTEAQVVEIFKSKQHQKRASNVAALYGINEKTVRDIWSGRTWSKETRHLEVSRPISFKQMGRPKGRRDRKQRKSRALSAQMPVLEDSALNNCSHSPEAIRDKSKELNSLPDTAKQQTIGQGQPSSSGIFQECFTQRQGENSLISIDEELYQWDQQGFWIDVIIDVLKNVP